MTELQQRALAQDMYDNPQDWRPKQPRIQCGAVRHFPMREILAWSVFAAVAIAGILALCFYGWRT